MAELPNINPYRWPGWFVAAMSLIYIIFVVLIFRETRLYSMPKHCKTHFCATGLILSAQLRSKWHIHLIVCSEMDICIHCTLSNNTNLANTIRPQVYMYAWVPQRMKQERLAVLVAMYCILLKKSLQGVRAETFFIGTKLKI